VLALAGIVVSSQIQSFPLWSSVYPAVLIFTTEGTEDHGVSLKLCWVAAAGPQMPGSPKELDRSSKTEQVRCFDKELSAVIHKTVISRTPTGGPGLLRFVLYPT